MTFLCAGALETSLEELKPEFERTSGHVVRAKYDAIGVITRRLREGEPADLATVSPTQWDELNGDGKLDPALRVVIAKLVLSLIIHDLDPKLSSFRLT